MNKPPFIAGQSAYRDGQPLSANPHPEKIVTGDDYPGPWANWRDGWNNEQAIQTWKGKPQ